MRVARLLRLDTSRRASHDDLARSGLGSAVWGCTTRALLHAQPHACAAAATQPGKMRTIVQKFAAQTASFCRHAPLFADKLHYLPTRSIICRHRHLFADTGSYLPTQATIRRQKRPFFADTFLTRLRSQPSETFHFPFRAPPSRPPPPTFGAPSRSASPAARPRFLPARQPARN